MTPNDTSHHCGSSTQNLVASVLPPILIIELLLGVPGNVMALLVFSKTLRTWRANVMFLFNLVLSDFLLLVSLPFRIDNFVRGESWIFGDAWCRINIFMLSVNRSASIAFMTAVAVDRYFKVAHPHHKINYISTKQAAGVACFIWAVVISLRIPLLANKLLNMENNISLCRSFSNYEKPSLGIRLHYAVFVLEFFLPLLLLIFCSVSIACILRIRQMDKDMKGKRAIRTVLVIVGVFVLCFSPSIGTGLTALYLKKLGDEYCKAYTFTSQLFSMSIAFTYLNSALDPVIYCFSSSVFRNHLKSAVNRTGIMELQMSRRGSMPSGSD
ncbi:hydroxycarboxylic acid receptor 2-like [Sinocyclocheilus rhinocerous]|uniref:hydroxycarboxylic acid receptor 2-like n=1 Tax=Sinocyclocheilus rhinocerous TaxID=307959 RepID=UPI0007B79196|nr:PREDICTED: hydroxycarboxylic acid receptor 2-like [Sinocyclocheilus rhinocerous]XP_016366544.1 PREDICTED: hydroxycarboxylic acid receptor 2-like [Sinocyclocheilus rhinocerous]XP_016366545.1 PREDICTED: hydroxycarboxylic acid receptor 2-like [Sinocyclocheilus rhinocerous]